MAAWIAQATSLELALACLAFFSATTLSMLALGYALERLPLARIWALPLEPGQVRLELLGNVLFVLVTSLCFFAVLGLGLPRFAAPEAGRGLATFFGLMWGFQAYYYGLHRLLHTKSLMRFHRWHHRSHVTTPLSAQSLSPVETLGWAVGYALLPALVSQLWAISSEGWLVYMAFNAAGNITGHARIELLPHLPVPRQFAWFANPSVYHALHHARFTGHYGFQSVVMDRCFGTEFVDWPALHARVGARKPLTSLRERG